MLQQPPVVTCRGTGPVQFPLSFLSQRDTDDMDPQTDARYKIRERRVLGNTPQRVAGHARPPRATRRLSRCPRLAKAWSLPVKSE